MTPRAHDRPKCERFDDLIMRHQKVRARQGAKPVATFADRALASRDALN